MHKAGPTIRLDGIGKVYAGTTVLEDISLKIDPGEMVCLTGPSGTGKSTLARISVGLTRPTTGNLYFQGDEMGGKTDIRKSAGRRQIVFQNPRRSLSPRLPVKEIVSEPADIIGAAVDPLELLDRVGLPAAFSVRYMKNLSVGECQRVALARALATDPEFLVLDEPTSSLDPIAASGILKYMRDNRNDQAILIVSHDRSVIGEADRILHLRHGRLTT